MGRKSCLSNNELGDKLVEGQQWVAVNVTVSVWLLVTGGDWAQLQASSVQHVYQYSGRRSGTHLQQVHRQC